ncbi:MAG: GrpB family protein [Longimicrobiales bacterium]
MEEVSFDGERWSNAAADPIELAGPDPGWPARFESAADEIRRALDGIASPRVEHVGSTAIPGIAAKPTLDILLMPAPGSDWSALVAPLESIGYVHWATNPRRDRMFFVRGMPPHGTGRTHHVHVRRPPEARAMLLFRYYLIAHPDAAARYERLKRELAARHATEREAYTRGKDAFVEAVLEEARSRG